jgi:hypothetical protein
MAYEGAYASGARITLHNHVGSDARFVTIHKPRCAPVTQSQPPWRAARFPFRAPEIRCHRSESDPPGSESGSHPSTRAPAGESVAEKAFGDGERPDRRPASPDRQRQRQEPEPDLRYSSAPHRLAGYPAGLAPPFGAPRFRLTRGWSVVPPYSARRRNIQSRLIRRRNADPKSSISTTPFRPILTFAGFQSRCTTLRPCAGSRVSTAGFAIRTAPSTGIGLASMRSALHAVCSRRLLAMAAIGLPPNAAS